MSLKLHAHCQAVVAGLAPGRLRPLGVAGRAGNQVAPPELANTPVQVVAGQLAAKIDLAVDRTQGVLQWLLCESAWAFNFGTRLQCPLRLVKGKKVVHIFLNLGEVFLKCVAGEAVADFLNLRAELNSRLLPLLCHPLGKPDLSLISVCSPSY